MTILYKITDLKNYFTLKSAFLFPFAILIKLFCINLQAD